MFNFKKKWNKVAEVAKQTFETPKDPNVIVAEIHEAFDTATDKLLSDAKAVLAGEYDVEKGQRLSKLGFTQAKKAVEAQEVIYSKSSNKILAEKIEYYQMHYPNNKFITEAKVKEICQKYGLLKAEVKYYISDVPEKNLSEIEKFCLKQEDMNEFACCWYAYSGSGYYSLVEKGTPNSIYGSHMRKDGWSNIQHEEDENVKSHYMTPAKEICASAKDFNTKNMRIEDGYKLSLNIPDPIVLQPVNGGYLVVSKWGLEGNDESLINEKHN